MGKNTGNPMLEMLFKTMGIDGASIVKQASDIGEAFAKLMAGQAELHAKMDRQTDMLWTIQTALGITSAMPLEGDMMKLIAHESRKHMGRTIIARDELGLPGDTYIDLAIVADAYVKSEEILKVRLGIYLEAYRDSEARLKVGIGHWVTEWDKLSEGNVISQVRCDDFFRNDLKIAMDAALAQMALAGITSADFLPWLACVNFQHGSGWCSLMPDVWKVICDGHYVEASSLLAARDYNFDTSVKWLDFRMALENLPPREART